MELINVLAVASIALAQLLVGILQLQGELINVLAVASGALAQLILQTSTLILQTSHDVGSIHQKDLLRYTLKKRDVADELCISQQQQFQVDNQRSYAKFNTFELCCAAHI